MSPLGIKLAIRSDGGRSESGIAARAAPEFRAIGALVLERWFPRIHADPTPPLDKLSGGMIFDEQNEDGEVWFVESARC